MSIYIMSQVWQKSQHRGSKLLMMLALADHAGDEGIAWPGIPSLAKKVRVKDKRWIRRTLRELEESGELVTLLSEGGQGSKSTNLYLIVLKGVPIDTQAITDALIERREMTPTMATQRAGEITLLLTDRSEGNHPPREGEIIPEGGSPSPSLGGSPSPPEPLLTASEPSNNPQDGASAAEESVFAGGFSKASQLKGGSRQVKGRKGKKKGYSSSKKDPAQIVMCPIHNEPMFPRDGGTRHSHQLPDGTWCNGTVPKAKEKPTLIKRELPGAQVTRL